MRNIRSRFRTGSFWSKFLGVKEREIFYKLLYAFLSTLKDENRNFIYKILIAMKRPEETNAE